MTPLNEDEGKLLIPLLERVKEAGFRFYEVFTDLKYATFENIATVHVKFEAEALYRIAKHWVIREDGEEEALRKRYQKMWKEDFFQVDADIPRVLHDLFYHHAGRRMMKEQVGAYFRNKRMRMYEETPCETLEQCFLRSTVEGDHGTAKRKQGLRRLECRGLKKVSTKLGLRAVAKLCTALIRLRRGEKEKLSSTEKLN